MSHSSRDPEQVRTDEGAETELCPAAAVPGSNEAESERRIPTPRLPQQELDHRSLQVIGESFEWLHDHEKELLRQHPEWEGQCAAVSSRTPSKLLAVAADRLEATAAALKSPELHDLAEREGLPAGYLFCLKELGDELFFDRPYVDW